MIDTGHPPVLILQIFILLVIYCSLHAALRKYTQRITYHQIFMPGITRQMPAIFKTPAVFHAGHNVYGSYNVSGSK